VVLGIALTGIIGFSGLLGGDGVIRALESAQPGADYAVFSLALASLAFLSLSFHFSVRALRAVKITVPAGYKAFTDNESSSEEIDENVLEAWASLPKKVMRKKIRLAYVK